MAWSAGTYTRSNGSSGWANDAAALIGIEAGRHDTVDNDFANGINNCLTKDGQNTASADLPMGGFKHTNVSAATARTNYVTAGQVIDNSLVYLGTAGGTANALTLTPTISISAYATSQRFSFAVGTTNTASATININGLGAKTIKRQNGRSLIGNELIIGTIYEIFYNGVDFVLLNPSSEWQAWTPTLTGFSANPTSATYRYKITPDGNQCTVFVDQPNRGTSNATNFLISAPVTSRATGTSAAYRTAANISDNGITLGVPGVAYIAQNTAIITIDYNWSGTGFTAANGKNANFILTYEI
jgi:hypothetical protein